ncbi:hypothetical protein MTR_2g437870 [Medicago truncatula]|uniref:Uncharacterized protein n=1 Tax=Medicago truncatula TaxID=3880 RepID=A0A072V7N7_MEDTR|nr:hypothetical protein MTR_2g437870 [Medicago truncatula]
MDEQCNVLREFNYFKMMLPLKPQCPPTSKEKYTPNASVKLSFDAPTPTPNGTMMDVENKTKQNRPFKLKSPI